MKSSLSWTSISKFLETILIFFSRINFFFKKSFNFVTVFNSVPETFCYGPEKSVKVENLKKKNKSVPSEECFFFRYLALLFIQCFPQLSPLHLNWASSVLQTIQLCRASVLLLSESVPAADLEGNFIPKR